MHSLETIKKLEEDAALQDTEVCLEIFRGGWSDGMCCWKISHKDEPGTLFDDLYALINDYAKKHGLKVPEAQEP